jgi:hypothetical protein
VNPARATPGYQARASRQIRMPRETVKRFLYRYQRMGAKGMYVIEMTCTIPQR